MATRSARFPTSGKPSAAKHCFRMGTFIDRLASAHPDLACRVAAKPRFLEAGGQLLINRRLVYLLGDLVGAKAHGDQWTAPGIGSFVLRRKDVMSRGDDALFVVSDGMGSKGRGAAKKLMDSLSSSRLSANNQVTAARVLVEWPSGLSCGVLSASHVKLVKSIWGDVDEDYQKRVCGFYTALTIATNTGRPSARAVAKGIKTLVARGKHMEIPPGLGFGPKMVDWVEDNAL